MEIPELLPGEPDRSRPKAPEFVVRLLLRAVFVALLAVGLAPLWPLYLLSALVWGRAPTMPRAAQVRRYLGHVFSVRPPPPGLPLLPRIWLLLSVLQKIAILPLEGLAWNLDHLLYGRQLRETPLVAPLIEISAARSGSTQLARYLEEDPQLAAPSLAQFFFPYLWLWKLAPRTIGRVFTPEWVRAKMDEVLPPEFLQRHEGDPFRTDTFDLALYSSHLNAIAPFFGPGVMLDDFAFGQTTPHNRAAWDEDFVEILDGIGRKTLVHAGAPRRFFVKGHFLAAAPALAKRYPDARFLTMIREPAPRLQSCINYLRANPVDPTLGPIPWTWLAEALPESEARYCEMEQAWFSRPEGPRRCVLRFGAYVRDLEGAMAKVYRECLDNPALPPHVPRVHPPRERTNYLLNRSLAQLGVDETAYNQRLAAYIAWCQDT